jgi:hypothetical protein
MDTTRRSFFRKTTSLAIGWAALAVSPLAQNTPDKKLLHVAVGDSNWEPTLEELQIIQTQVMLADLDPKGGLLVTRNGIEITRV